VAGVGYVRAGVIAAMSVYGGGFSPQPPEPPVRPASRRSGGRRTAILIGAIAAVVVGAGTATAAVVLGNPSSDPPAPLSTSAAAGTPSGPAAKRVADGITMTATGDIVMGKAPGGLPPNDGQGFFDDVKGALAADFQMGNLEQTITDDTGVGKCSAESAGSTCFAYRTPPAFVHNLKDAGFMLMNQANNHAYDFGPAGFKNTQKNLDSVGIKYTGWPGMITVVEIKGVKIAVLGFASYTWSNLCSDLDRAGQLVTRAKGQADLVVVQVHQGGEGSDRQHVKPGTEYYLGENRCDPMAFGHAVIDAGADLVVGHGPHVVRAMEFYKGHLIAYSLGNLAGYRALSYKGVVGVGAILKVRLGADGSWQGGSVTPTAMIAPGLPRLDTKKQAISLIGNLSKSDFPSTGAHIGTDGSITPR
jgi:poly-gamma-glutamate capsule biosynthesis protein CapA/YwtB (metallophosphatase superfamily)